MSQQKMNLFQRKINPKELKLSVPLSQDGQDHLLDSNFQSPRKEIQQQFNINAYHEVDQSNISANVQYSQVNNSLVKTPELNDNANFSKKMNPDQNKPQPKLERLFQEDVIEQRGNLNQTQQQQSYDRFTQEKNLNGISDPINIQENKKETIQKQTHKYQEKQIEGKKSGQQQNPIQTTQKQQKKPQRKILHLNVNNEHTSNVQEDNFTPRRLTNQNYKQYNNQDYNPVRVQTVQYVQPNEKQLKSFSVDQTRNAPYKFNQHITYNFNTQNYQQEKLENTSKKTIIQKKDNYQKNSDNYKELYFGQKLINQQLQEKVKELEEQLVKMKELEQQAKRVTDLEKEVKNLKEDKKSIVEGYEQIVANMQNLQKLEKEVQEINEKKQLFSKELGQLTGDGKNTYEILQPKVSYDIPEKKNSLPYQHNQAYIKNDFDPFNKTVSYQRSSDYNPISFSKTTSFYRQPQTKQRISIASYSRDIYQPRTQRIYKTNSHTNLQLIQINTVIIQMQNYFFLIIALQSFVVNAENERELFIPKYQMNSTYTNALNATNQNLYQMSESSRNSIQMGKVHKLFADVEEMLDDMRDHFQNQIRVLQQNLTRPKVPHDKPIQIQENIWEKPDEANENQRIWAQHSGLNEVFSSPKHKNQEALNKEIKNDNPQPNASMEANLENESQDRVRRRRRQKKVL